MDIRAGLGGQAIDGLASELEISLFSSQSFTGEVEITDGLGRTVIPVQIDEQKLNSRWLAVTPDRHQPIQVNLVINGNRVLSKQLTFEVNKNPFSIISSSIPRSQTLDKLQYSNSNTPLILPSMGLPHTIPATAGVAAIVTEPESLASLTDAQYNALNHYLERCGFMLVTAAQGSMLKRLKNISGCNGRFVQVFDDITQIPALLDRMQSQRPPGLPSASDLLSLQPTDLKQQMVPTITIFLGAYILLILLISLRLKNLNYLFLLPVFASIAGIIAWSGQGSQQMISWAETESGDNQVRVSSLLLSGGNRQGNSSINIGSEIHVLKLNKDSQRPDFSYSKQASYRVMQVKTHLLRPHSLELKYVSHVESPFLLKLENNIPKIIFQGSQPEQNCLLLWQGHTYEIPTLIQGSVWQPEPGSGRQPGTAMERLLNRHLNYDSAALLLPYESAPAHTGTPTMKPAGWLVIRHDQGQLL